MMNNSFVDDSSQDHTAAMLWAPQSALADGGQNPKPAAGYQGWGKYFFRTLTL
jgi:hypothetical protein